MKRMRDLYVGKSKVQGVGLFSKRSYEQGDTIGIITGDVHVFRKFTREISERMLNWIGVGRFSWIDTTKSIFRFINHSCEPTAIIVGKRTIKAYKDIPIGTEITMDYSITEAEPDWGFECSCGSKRCRKYISKISDLPLSVYKDYLPNIPKNFQKIYESDRRASIHRH